MGGLYSKPTTVKKETPPISDIDRAVLDLKNARDRLQRYRKKLHQDEAKLVEQARKAKTAGRNDTALGLLRLRKYKQAQAATCEDQLLNVLQMVETIDSKQNEKAVLDALANGKDTLKKMHEETSVDHVLELMDQVQEEIAVEQEITEILQGVPTLSPTDELAVEQELAALQEEVLGEKVPELPTVPATKLPTTTTPQQEVAQPQKTASTTKPERVAVPG